MLGVLLYCQGGMGFVGMRACCQCIAVLRERKLLCSPSHPGNMCLLPQGRGPLPGILDLVSNELYRALLEDMLSMDPSKRPTEKQAMAAVCSESKPSCSKAPSFLLTNRRVSVTSIGGALSMTDAIWFVKCADWGPRAFYGFLKELHGGDNANVQVEAGLMC